MENSPNQGEGQELSAEEIAAKEKEAAEAKEREEAAGKAAAEEKEKEEAEAKAKSEEEAKADTGSISVYNITGNFVRAYTTEHSDAEGVENGKTYIEKAEGYAKKIGGTTRK